MESISSYDWSRDSILSSDDQFQYSTSLDRYDFMYYMNQTGWSQGGIFSTLLSTAGYDLQREKGRMVLQQEMIYDAADTLTLLIFELYDLSIIVITSSNSLPRI